MSSLFAIAAYLQIIFAMIAEVLGLVLLVYIILALHKYIRRG